MVKVANKLTRESLGMPTLPKEVEEWELKHFFTGDPVYINLKDINKVQLARALSELPEHSFKLHKTMLFIGKKVGITNISEYFEPMSVEIYDSNNMADGNNRCVAYNLFNEGEKEPILKKVKVQPVFFENSIERLWYAGAANDHPDAEGNRKEDLVRQLKLMLEAYNADKGLQNGLGFYSSFKDIAKRCLKKSSRRRVADEMAKVVKKLHPRLDDKTANSVGRQFAKDNNASVSGGGTDSIDVLSTAKVIEVFKEMLKHSQCPAVLGKWSPDANISNGKLDGHFAGGVMPLVIQDPGYSMDGFLSSLVRCRHQAYNQGGQYPLTIALSHRREGSNNDLDSHVLTSARQSIPLKMSELNKVNDCSTESGWIDAVGIVPQRKCESGILLCPVVEAEDGKKEFILPDSVGDSGWTIADAIKSWNRFEEDHEDI